MTKRTFFQKPLIHDEEERSLHRKVSWLELFFDLFFVVIIAQLSHKLAAEPGIHGIKEFIMLFIPVWWVWIGNTFYNERFETEGFESRLFTLLLMFPVAGMAIFSYHGLTETYKGFAFSYAVARLIIIFMWFFGGLNNANFRPVSNRFILGFSISVVLVIFSVYVGTEWNKILFGSALLIDLITPVFTLKHQARLPRLSTSKLPERFGLFVIIVLGETIVGVISGISAHSIINVDLALLSVMGIIISFGFWWVYFDFIARRHSKKGIWWSFTWSYLHLPLLMSIVAMGAGLLVSISHLGVSGYSAAGELLIYSAALALVTLGFIEITLLRYPEEPTHRFLSPTLKISGGLILFVEIVHQPLPVLLLIIFVLLIQIGYGMYVWFFK